jgi:hypothetical protein
MTFVAKELPVDAFGLWQNGSMIPVRKIFFL